MCFRKKCFIHSLILAILLVLGSNQIYAQLADEELAAQFYANREFAKAADMYENLLSKNQKSVYFYDNLLNCIILWP
jgi:hypothetical protein